ncbi:MAG: carbon starvation protein A, partial [Marinilabiliales bacterium]
MISFIIAVIALVLGYIIYGAFVEKVFGVDPKRKTPAYTMTDGVDYVPMPWWKVLLIQFLNIAGLGPIFGAIAGAMWGPSAFLWIVIGNIFGGALHDFFSGAISIRLKGISLPEITGRYLGKGIMQFMRGFNIALMVLVGAVFIIGPAAILEGLTPFSFEFGGTTFATNLTFWAVIIFAYYFIATMLPVDKIIGRLYPIFGLALIFMAIGILIALFAGDYQIPEIIGNMNNQHSKGDAMPIFPMMFVSIACGAVSGFHATQSPLMARCIKSEKYSRRVFYGAMVIEGVVALIWAAAAMAFFGGVKELNLYMISNNGNAASAVHVMSETLLGSLGAILAILGVVAAPITSGDTAFRSARLIVADFIKINQKPIVNRLLIAIPLFILGFVITQIDFGIIWRYMAWSNQMLAL